MRFFISKRLPLGFRAGVLFDPVRMGRPAVRAAVNGSLARLGEGVAGIYVITGSHNMCKIGISTDPELRLAALQTGAHVPLKLHYVLAVKSMDPRYIEAEAHRLLDKHRCAGEWFDVPPQIAEDAVNRAAAHFGIRTAQTTSDAPLLPQVAPANPIREFGKTVMWCAIASAIGVTVLRYFSLIP